MRAINNGDNPWNRVVFLSGFRGNGRTRSTSPLFSSKSNWKSLAHNGTLWRSQCRGLSISIGLQSTIRFDYSSSRDESRPLPTPQLPKTLPSPSMRSFQLADHRNHSIYANVSRRIPPSRLPSRSAIRFVEWDRCVQLLELFSILFKLDGRLDGTLKESMDFTIEFYVILITKGIDRKSCVEDSMESFGNRVKFLFRIPFEWTSREQRWNRGNVVERRR